METFLRSLPSRSNLTVPFFRANSVSSFTLAHVGAGMDLGAALTDQDVAGQHELAVTALDAQALGLGVTTVTGGADALLVGENWMEISIGVTPPFLVKSGEWRQDSPWVIGESSTTWKYGGTPGGARQSRP